MSTRFMLSSLCLLRSDACFSLPLLQSLFFLQVLAFLEASCKFYATAATRLSTSSLCTDPLSLCERPHKATDRQLAREEKLSALSAMWLARKPYTLKLVNLPSLLRY